MTPDETASSDGTARADGRGGAPAVVSAGHHHRRPGPDRHVHRAAQRHREARLAGRGRRRNGARPPATPVRGRQGHGGDRARPQRRGGAQLPQPSADLFPGGMGAHLPGTQRLPEHRARGPRSMDHGTNDHRRAGHPRGRCGRCGGDPLLDEGPTDRSRCQTRHSAALPTRRRGGLHPRRTTTDELGAAPGTHPGTTHPGHGQRPSRPAVIGGSRPSRAPAPDHLVQLHGGQRTDGPGTAERLRRRRLLISFATR